MRYLYIKLEAFINRRVREMESGNAALFSCVTAISFALCIRHCYTDGHNHTPRDVVMYTNNSFLTKEIQI